MRWRKLLLITWTYDPLTVEVATWNRWPSFRPRKISSGEMVANSGTDTPSLSPNALQMNLDLVGSEAVVEFVPAEEAREREDVRTSMTARRYWCGPCIVSETNTVDYPFNVPGRGLPHFPEPLKQGADDTMRRNIGQPTPQRAPAEGECQSEDRLEKSSLPSDFRQR